MANGPRNPAVDGRFTPTSRHTLRSDPSLPRTLVDLMLATGDAASVRHRRRRGARAPGRPLPRRLPGAIAVEVPPNILYRRYPLVTTLLVELDELRRVGSLPPPRRGR